MACRRPSAFIPNPSRRPSHRVLTLSVQAAVLAMGVVASGAMAQSVSGATPAVSAPDAPKAYRIAPGPLDEALGGFAAAAGVSITVPPALVQGKTTRGLDGGYTVRDGFARLLAGSGLEVTGGAGGAFALRRAVGGDTEATGSTLASVTVTAQAERSATTEGSRSYAARATTIGKGEQALKDIPQSVSVVTRQQLDDQGITDLRDAANIATGMVGVKGIGPGMVLSARGFQIDDWQYDGVAIPRNSYALGNWGTESLVFFDRLEVLRGSSGLLQGTGSPGGAVNLVRKRGQTEKTLTLTTKAGSWDRYGVQLDAGGPLNAEGTLRGRIVLDEARSHSFTDYVNSRTHSFYGALDYDISPDTTVGVGIGRSDNKGRPMIRGLPRYPDGSDIGLPRSTYVGAWWNRMEIEQTTLFADVSHRFNPDWTLKAAAVRLSEKNTSLHQRMHGNVAADGSGLTYANWVTDFDSVKTGLDVHVNGRFRALGLENDVTFGANISKYTSDDLTARTFQSGGNIFAIDNNRPRQSLALIMAQGGLRSDSTYDVEQKGVYGTWRMKLADPLTAIVGARVSWYDYLYTTTQASRNSAHGEVTPYLGLVYALNDRWSAYGSVTSVFVPQSERTVAGQVLDPIKGTNYELGIKGELADGRVNTSLAVFRYDHKNRAVNDIASGYACDGWYCSTPSGKVRSQGVEAEVTGELLPGLQAMLGYTYNTTEFLRDPTNQGQVFSQWTPKHMLRVWADYRLPGDWHRLSVGGGVTMQSHTLGYDRTFTVPGFSVWGMRLAYQATPEISLAVNLNNVFDKRYWIPGYAEKNGANEYGDPRNLMFTVKYTPKL